MTEPAEFAELTIEALRENRFCVLPASTRADAAVRARLESILGRTDPPATI